MKTNQRSQKPYAVYVVEGEGDKVFWTKVGAAWRHEDGKGLNISLSCLPLNGRPVIREPKADARRGGEPRRYAALRRRSLKTNATLRCFLIDATGMVVLAQAGKFGRWADGGMMKVLRAGVCALPLAGCAAFPESPEQARFDIRKVVDSIECELAAAATDPDPQVKSRNLILWTTSTDLDITLDRSIGGDGNVKIAAPYGLADVSALPKIGGADTDTRINSLKFATSMHKAVARWGGKCAGPNPSETNMGLAYWLEGTVKALDEDSLLAVSYTKQFKIELNGGARFGYTLVPVTNTVAADLGFTASRDYTNRFTIALTPPPPPPAPVKPIPVRVVNWLSKDAAPTAPKPPAPPPGGAHTMTVPPEGTTDNPPADATTKKVEKQSARPRRPRSVQPPALSARQRALQDPLLQQMLQRKSPVFLSQ